MKKIGILFLFILAISCKKEPKLNFVVVSGKIDNYNYGIMNIFNSDNSVREELKIEKDGTFKDTIYAEDGLYTLSFRSQNFQVYLENSNELIVNFDAKYLQKSISFTGKGSETSKYVYEKGKKLKELVPNDDDLFKLEQIDFLLKVDEIERNFIEILENSKGISKSFKKLEMESLKYFKLWKLELYKINHPFLSKNYNLKLSPDFLKRFESIDLNNEDLFSFSEDYRSLLNSIYLGKSFEQNSNTLEIDNTFFSVVQKEVKSELIKNGLTFNYVNSKLDFSNDKENLYNSFINASTNQFYNDRITEKYNDYKKIAKGQPSPEFNDYENLNGGKSSLKDFNGKLILINVWSSSMAPSAIEFQALNDLKKKYDLDLVNISIDINNFKENWKQTIKDNNVAGVHLLADNNWNSEFIKNYKVKIVPRYILLDKNGVIVNSDCPKPSSPKFAELINSLNI